MNTTPETNKTPRERQVGGSHYKDMPIQPIEYAYANGLDPYQMTILKYVVRHPHKGGIEDLKKALHTLEMYIEVKEQEKPSSDYWSGPDHPFRVG